MEFTAYLETENNYKPEAVIKAFHACLERGEQKMLENEETEMALIINDIRNNLPTIERE